MDKQTVQAMTPQLYNTFRETIIGDTRVTLTRFLYNIKPLNGRAGWSLMDIEGYTGRGAIRETDTVGLH